MTNLVELSELSDIESSKYPVKRRLRNTKKTGKLELNDVESSVKQKSKQTGKLIIMNDKFS